MLAPNLTQAEFLQALQALLPRGRAWPNDPAATLTAVLNGLAGPFATQTGAANGLLVDAFPSTTNHLLPEWQSTLSQPDPAGPTPSGTAQAQQFVAAKFASLGGQSQAYFIAFAAAYGITITIQQMAPFRAGNSRAGQQCGTTDWFYVWNVTMPAADAAYEGLLQEVAPAHTILNFTLI
ncbi:MAG: DUF2313 domain-containing protein [Patescibacteria group bacterium]|nr:DUF2313 domain-containing protein [Patescibacteria group bacterium]